MVPVFVGLRDKRVRGLILVVKSSCHESLSLLWHGHHRPQGAAQAGQCIERPSIVNPVSAAQSFNIIGSLTWSYFVVGAFAKGASDVFNASLTHRKLQEEIRSRMSSVYV